MMQSQGLAIGIEIGGTKTQVGIGTQEGSLLPGGVVRRPVNRDAGAEGILRDLLSMVDESLFRNQIQLSEVSKVGIGFGGPLDSVPGIILKSFQVEGWSHFPLRQWAETQWGKPVCLENDASTAGLAEATLGNGRGCARVFYVTAGSGVGGGWIVDGRIDNGQGLGAAEIGHMWVPDPESSVLLELEQICSGWAIGRRARAAASQGQSVMQEMAGSLDAIEARIVYQAAERGDELAIRILKDTCRTLGVALSNVVTLLHPQRIILGGGVSLMGPLFWDALQQEFRSRLMPVFASGVELVPAALGEEVVVIGALLLASIPNQTS